MTDNKREGKEWQEKNYAVEAPDIGRNSCIPPLNSPVAWENTALFSLLDVIL